MRVRAWATALRQQEGRHRALDVLVPPVLLAWLVQQIQRRELRLGLWSGPLMAPQWAQVLPALIWDRSHVFLPGDDYTPNPYVAPERAWAGLEHMQIKQIRQVKLALHLHTERLPTPMSFDKLNAWLVQRA